MPTPDPLAPLAELPGVADGVARARTACAELRGHEAFRRRWREVRLEALVRAASASVAVEGVRVAPGLVRSVATGGPVPDDPGAAAAVGALRAGTAAARWVPDLGARGGPPLPPLPQLLAAVHAAVVGPGDGAERGVAGAGRDLEERGVAGRLRTTGRPGDLRGLGPAPSGDEVAARVALLADVVGRSRAPAVLVAGVVHGELLTLRPFVTGNGVVARTVFRLLLAVRGLDPTATVVPDIAWAAAPTAYLSAAAGFATGTPAGVGRWLVGCCDAVVAGAVAAREAADEVLRGGLAGERATAP